MPTQTVLNDLPFQSNNDRLFEYPVAGLVVFGNEAAHGEFSVPMARFQFYNSVGSARLTTEAPTLFIRMGGQFQTGLANAHEASTNIYGNPSGDATDDALFQVPENLKGGLSALYKQIAGVGTGAAGYLASAGTSGKAQYEFLSRRVLNTFQQLIYQGPTFRRYTLPFVMKPTSLDEAKAMINIIKTFRIASSPKGGAPEKLSKERVATAEETDAIPRGENDTIIDNVIGLLANTPIAFGYPDMCSFEIVMVEPTVGSTPTQIFGSEFCVIENVQVDYGSQNKMLFFQKDTTGKYYPAEVTLTINLKETTLPLGAQISKENSSRDASTRTIF
jgi:hypothetical protein